MLFAKKTIHQLKQISHICLLFMLSLNLLLPFLTPEANAATVSILNPHKGYSYNYKGNLHAHTTNSDGSDSPTTVGEWYRDNGYDFYTITDHNYLTPDPGVSGILWLGSSEEDSLDGNTAHMNHINISSPISSGSAQERIDNSLSQGGFTDLNHIDRSDKRWTAETIEGLNNVMALEIYNGGGLNSTGTWDTVLTSGKTVWGEAADDSHSAGGRGGAYVVVNSDLATLTESEIMSEMRTGNFYASRGFELTVSAAGNTISASTSNGNKIRWIKKNGDVIKTTSSASDSYTVNGSEQYVRVEILDSSNVAKAWSQPIMVSGAIHRFYNLQNGSHFYTSDQAEATYVNDNLYSTYRYEGVSYNAYRNQVTDMVPVHRFYNFQNGAHFYTSNQAEATYVNDNLYLTYRYEGVSYYVNPTQEVGTSPVHRFYNFRGGFHFYTSNQSEATYVNDNLYSTYRYEGPAWYLVN